MSYIKPGWSGIATRHAVSFSQSVCACACLLAATNLLILHHRHSSWFVLPYKAASVPGRRRMQSGCHRDGAHQLRKKVQFTEWKWSLLTFSQFIFFQILICKSERFLRPLPDCWALKTYRVIVNRPCSSVCYIILPNAEESSHDSSWKRKSSALSVI